MTDGMALGSERLFAVLCRLYDTETNCEIGTFWDGGLWARIGDRENGYVWNSGHGYYSAGDLATALLGAAIRLGILKGA